MSAQIPEVRSTEQLREKWMKSEVIKLGNIASQPFA